MAKAIRIPPNRPSSALEVTDAVGRAQEHAHDADHGDDDDHVAEPCDDPHQLCQPHVGGVDEAAGEQGRCDTGSGCGRQHHNVLMGAHERHDLDPLSPHAVFETARLQRR